MAAHIRIRFGDPSKGVVAENLPVGSEDLDLILDGCYSYHSINPDAAKENLDALHMLIGEELLNAQITH